MASLIGIVSTLLLTFLNYHSVQSKGFVRVCYYTNWSRGRSSGGAYKMQTHYEDRLCTHLIYSFGKVAFDGKGWAIAPYEDHFDIKTGYPTMNNILKKRDPNLKTLLAIGGWNHGSAGFKEMVATVESRRYFIKQSKEFIIEHGKFSYNNCVNKFEREVSNDTIIIIIIIIIIEQVLMDWTWIGNTQDNEDQLQLTNRDLLICVKNFVNIMDRC